MERAADSRRARLGMAILAVYDRVILGRPRASLLALLAFIGCCVYWLKDFRLDASGDQLVLEHDDDVRYNRKIADRYGSGDFVVVTYTPPEGLFAKPAMDRLARLAAELKALPRVSSVVHMLNAPLLRNPPGTLKDLQKNIKSLDSPGADIELAKAEFRDSPIYQNLLVSSDLRSTAIQVNFELDSAHGELSSRRYRLREKLGFGTPEPGERAELARIEEEYRRQKDEERERRHGDIAAIRSIIARYRPEAAFCLGGVPMIVDDIISYVGKDIRVFGAGMILFLIAVLTVIFREPRYVALPIACSVFSVVIMTGLLGLCRWDITVVSSNFISLQLVFTMELAIHIIMRYRELLRERPGEDNRSLVYEMVRDTFVPIVYAIATTIAGFASLVFCDVLPIVSFGWMMSLGLCVSLALAYLLLPPVLLLLPKPTTTPSAEKELGHGLASFFAGLTERRPGLIYAVSAAMAVLTFVGMTRLEVENSFINYFKESTDIYQGMKFIDEELGGTTPVDITLDFGAPPPAPAPSAAPAAADEFSDFEEFEEQKDPAKYWFTADKLERINAVHDYLDALPATGKVLSLATIWKTAATLNDGKPLDDLSLAILFNSMPERFSSVLIAPFVSVKDGQARISARIKDSMSGLRRDALLRQIRRDLVEKLGLREDQFRVTGLMVLYNNMLQSLYTSQVKTIGFTTLTLVPMFLALFRSLRIALLIVVPNFLASMVVLGVMGVAGIPLDVMTITIVAIAVGIAVDNTMHYLVRFGEEIRTDGDYRAAMRRCHGSIGHAMQYATLTIATGFCILAFSNFIPTILFGLLTAFALAMALLVAMTLLPLLLILFKPYGPERTPASGPAPEKAKIPS